MMWRLSSTILNHGWSASHSCHFTQTIVHDNAERPRCYEAEKNLFTFFAGNQLLSTKVCYHGSTIDHAYLQMLQEQIQLQECTLSVRTVE